MVLRAGRASYKASNLLYTVDCLYYDIETFQRGLKLTIGSEPRYKNDYLLSIRPSDSSITGSLQLFAYVL